MHKLQPTSRKDCTPVFLLQCCHKLIQPVETTYQFLFTRICLRRTNYHRPGYSPVPSNNIWSSQRKHHPPTNGCEVYSVQIKIYHTNSSINKIPHPEYGPNTGKNTQTGTRTTDAEPRNSTNEITDQLELKMRRTRKEKKISQHFIIKLLK